MVGAAQKKNGPVREKTGPFASLVGSVVTTWEGTRSLPEVVRRRLEAVLPLVLVAIMLEARDAQTGHA